MSINVGNLRRIKSPGGTGPDLGVYLGSEVVIFNLPKAELTATGGLQIEDSSVSDPWWLARRIAKEYGREDALNNLVRCYFDWSDVYGLKKQAVRWTFSFPKGRQPGAEPQWDSNEIRAPHKDAIDLAEGFPHVAEAVRFNTIYHRTPVDDRSEPEKLGARIAEEDSRKFKGIYGELEEFAGLGLMSYGAMEVGVHLAESYGFHIDLEAGTKLAEALGYSIDAPTAILSAMAVGYCAKRISEIAALREERKQRQRQ